MRLLRPLLRYTLTIALAIAILLLLLWPSPQLSQEVGQMDDKIAHAGLFFLLGLVFWSEYIWRHPQGSSVRPFLLLTPLLLTFAGGSELLQMALPQCHRSADWLDFVADCVGIALATPIGLAYHYWYKHKH